MARAQLKHLTWSLRRLAGAVPPLILLAAVVLVADGLFYTARYTSMQHQEASLKVQIRQPADRAQDQVGSTPHLLSADMAAFYRRLPKSTDASRMLRRLHEIAADEDLWIEQAEYRPVRDADGKLVLYQMTWPAKGAYPDVRRFLSRALREVPGLAIGGVSFQRQRIGETELDAQIKMTLYLTAGAG